MSIDIWRAPTDNDQYVKAQWFAARYDHATTRAYDMAWSADGGVARISVTMGVVAPVVQRIATVKAVWTIASDGRWICAGAVERDTHMPFLPRFGCGCCCRGRWTG